MDYENTPDLIFQVVQMLPYQTLITIDPVSKNSQYQQVVDQILSCIKNGIMPSGTKLPSTRQLATMLHVHRKTVIAAYEELISQGWIVPKSRSGYYINAELVIPEKPESEKQAALFPANLPGGRSERYGVDRLAVHSKLTGREYSHIDDGLPDARLAPFDTLLREYKTIAHRHYKLKKVNAGSMGASIRLNEAIARHLSKSRGFLPGAANIMVTNGAQMGIYLVGQALINQGDVIIAGFPGYTLANLTFQNQGAKIMEVPVDEDGINIDAVEDICRQQAVKAIYVVPHHHYPTTATLSPQRRLKMIALSSRYNFLIIEDDYDYDYHYSSSPHLPMATYPHAGRVIYIGSLSKSFSASLRLGFVVASSDLIEEMGYLRRSIDIRGDFLMEEAAAAMFENGEMERHTKRSVKVYKERRELFCDALDRDLKVFVSYVRPAGGLAVWLGIKQQYDADLLAELISREGFCLHPKAVFGIKQNLNHFRIGFASINQQEINELVAAMKNAFNNYKTEPDEKQT